MGVNCIEFLRCKVQQAQLTLSVGTIIRERYRIEALLGQDSSGALYLVKDQLAGQSLYVLKERVEPDKRERDRFIFECVMLKRLDHQALPHIYRVFDEPTHQRAYALIEYIPGPNLETLRQQQPEECFPLLQVLTLMAPVLDAVSYLHSQHPPIIHEDIKPANIIVPTTGSGSVLVNFAIAGEAGSSATVPPCSPGYGAPEQYDGKANTRSDIYALGATVYTLLTGIVPPDARDRKTQLENQDSDPLIPVNAIEPTIPAARAEAIQRALSIKSESRFSKVEEFWQAVNSDDPLFTAEEFERILNTLPVTPVPFSFSPVADEQREGDVVTQPLQSQRPSVIRPRKSAILLSIVLVLLIGSGVGMGLWVFVGGHYSSNAVTATSGVPPKTTSAHPTPQSTGVPTPNPYPGLASSYTGTIHNIAANTTANMSLTGIQQNQENFTGYFTPGNGLQGNSPFSGTFNTSKHFQFIVIRSGGQMPLSFEGAVQSDGTLAGSYCSLDQQKHCAGEYGLWSVIPAS
jgi:serine/threonine protein kinase